MADELTDTVRIQALQALLLDAVAGARPWEAIIALSAAVDLMRTRLSTEAVMRTIARSMNMGPR